MTDDLRDPCYAERLEAEAPGEGLRRREFLERLAVTAGLGTALATTLDPAVLMAEAARRQRRHVGLPSPGNMPIDTFVILMMENRSFDHYLGWLPGADGRQAGLSYAGREGSRLATAPLGQNFQGCGHPDPDHTWDGGRAAVNGGRMDGFLRAGDNDEFAIGYYGQEDLPFLGHAAQAFTTFDRFFCSLLSSTRPNRLYAQAAQSYGLKANDDPPPGGFPDSTISRSLQRRGLSVRHFYSDVPTAGLWGRAGLARSRRIEDYYARAAVGRLPSLSFVDPPFVGEGIGLSGDEHPHSDIRLGQAFIADVVHAFMESPQWRRGALFIIYDEWGGFFDHVPPPRVPDAGASENPAEDFAQMGCRVPAVVVSPWVRRGHVAHGQYGFESILRLIEYRFGLRPLTLRDAYAANIGEAFDWRRTKHRFERPELPDPAPVVPLACPGPELGPDDEAGGPTKAGAATATGLERPEPHEIMELVTSGYLKRLGFRYRPVHASDIFREPSRLRRVR